MLSIKPSHIPEYLKCSAFFGSLGEEDEEVSVPKDCCKQDTSVTNAADLDELLRTLRFWGVDCIPESVVCFVITKCREIWNHILESFAKDLLYITHLLKVVSSERDLQVCVATEIGNVDIVSCLLKHQYSTKYKSYVDFSTKCTQATDIAARKGNLEILQVLCRHNCPFRESTGKAAAMGGHITALQYLMENGCPIAGNLVKYAFAGGSIACLRYVHETLGCTWLSNLFDELKFLYTLDMLQYPGAGYARCAETSLLQCLKYALSRYYPLDLSDACVVCAEKDWPLLLQHLHEHTNATNGKNNDMNINIAAAAARSGSLGCLKCAVVQGCQLTDEVFRVAMLSGSVHTIQYLHDLGLPWPQHLLDELDDDGDDTTEDNVAVCLAYAYKLGCPRDPDTCYYASKYGWYDILVDAHEHGCAWDEFCTRQAASCGRLNCLVYLHEHGCPWDESIPRAALQYYFDCGENSWWGCLKYAVEQGCPVCADTLHSYEVLVREGTIK